MQRDFSRTLFHVDMDSFFASIEVRDDPRLKGRPVIVGGSRDSRSVVSSPSYEARKFGVHSAMPISEAKRRCPDAVFLPGSMKKYVECSKQLRKVLLEFTREVEPFSIDEAFLEFFIGWDRVERIRQTGEEIRQAIREEMQLPATIGIGPNKMLAKLASKAGKPDGLFVIPPEKVDAFLVPLPVGKLWGVGERTRSMLHRRGIFKVGDLRKFPPGFFRDNFGAWGESLGRKAWGIDEAPLCPWYQREDPKSLGHEETYEKDLTDPEEIRTRLMGICEEVGRRLRKQGYRTRLVTVKRRLPEFTLHTRGHTLAVPTDLDKDLFEAASRCLKEFKEPWRPIRLLGVTASRLSRKEEEKEASLFDPLLEPENQLTETLDKMKQKYGPDIISRGRRRKPEE
jgi:DNA polymerase IV